MKMLDLFSGIGGFSLAASRVWDDLEIVSFCEIDPFCKKVLNKNFPGVPVHNDIKTLKGDSFGTIDLITGGFPCQPFSVAGKQRGKEDDRYLWDEMLRVIKESKAKWIVGENVANLWNMGIENMLLDLENEGYEVESFIIPACGIGAVHRRERVWIVANSTGNRLQRELRQDSGKENRSFEAFSTFPLCTDKKQLPTPYVIGGNDGLSKGMDKSKRIKSLGNSIVPQIAEIIFRAIKENI